MLQTKKLVDASQMPSQLDGGRILDVRAPTSSAYVLRNLEAGLVGENELVAFLERYGRKEWKGLRNLWLNVSGKFECDFVLLANAGLHLFEIKNYKGHFVYENGDCRLNNRILSDNPVTQTKRNFRKLQSIMHRLDMNIHVTGTLVFIGEHNFVEIKDSMTDIAIIKRDQLRDFVLQLAAVDQPYRQPLNADRILKQLERYEDENYFVPQPLSNSEMNSIRKGIYCVNCHRFDLEMSKLYIHCSCGHKERRETGILRTLCEYNVLTMKRRITLGEAYDFIDGQASARYLLTLLKKYFSQHLKSRYTYYEIDPLPFYKTVLL